MNYYKILNKEENHNGLQYKTGLNKDHLPFNPTGDCEPGGIYFSREDIFEFLNYGPYIRKVTLPKDAQIYENPETPKKWKSDKVILGRKRKWNNLKLIRELIDEGANIEPLWFCAARYGYLDIIKLLLKAGANPNIKDSSGNTALIWVSINGHLNIVRLLLKAGANPNIKDSNGNTALTRASRHGHLDIVKLLLKAGADPNIQNNYGYTALIWASRHGHLDIIKLLLKAGANPNIKNIYGATALIYASRHGHLEIVKLLESLK